ncbi:DUF1972 domain-containing protein [Shouchella clausii]|jgi:rhamnosyltransferase|uniref:beta 1-4 rhamnosyltransferase Cps2T n=1 Tax=Shouchella TaxID=2893057 RepID=UPI0004E637E2|nr:MULTISPECIES: DUF1972 domain-containing protein [Shouchella]MCM3311033.1 DUF1972 domain-containing protein [Psychrobacillus sp. MER TA 17]ALA53347.1 Alpha-D-GlcNAc alpha-1,2-L-rhamnosyltransferase [Shouchella clausii]MBU3231127.1 DUF1972 domain-containing protein [Shouchella clausii]MBU3263869.1 DUF1972 domain-containing protein [Shouchella clausii]MBU3508169.1 DUF1972 domain-containing protein [Shouchella clausii]
MINVFIIGSKGIPAKYGGFETFVEHLTKMKTTDEVFYNVACLSEEENEFQYNNVRCFNVKVPNIGSSRAVLYDINAIKKTIVYIKEKKIKNAIVYVLACRIGPFIKRYKKQLAALGAKLYVNPDGHEWKRSKWSYPIRKYWKISERLMVKHADLLICDSRGIESYIKKDYSVYNPNTTYIAYGADFLESKISDNDQVLLNWQKENNVSPNNYYLIVGRFVPENNYELIIREYMKSNSNKDLVIISNVEDNYFYKELLKRTQFKQDKRIKFVGTVYNQDLLKKIREQAYGYFHGHEVGGTNPSLLEALAATKINLLLDVNFNREVGDNGAFYFNKEENNLAKLIDKADHLSYSEVGDLELKAKNRVKSEYSWEKIVTEYEELFLGEKWKEGKL